MVSGRSPESQGMHLATQTPQGQEDLRMGVLQDAGCAGAFARPQADGLQCCCAVHTAPQLSETQGQACHLGRSAGVLSVSHTPHRRPSGSSNRTWVWSSGLNHPECSVTISSQAGKGDRGRRACKYGRGERLFCTYILLECDTHLSSYLPGTGITRCHTLPSGGGRSSSRDQMFRSVHVFKRTERQLY